MVSNMNHAQLQLEMADAGHAELHQTQTNTAKAEVEVEIARQIWASASHKDDTAHHKLLKVSPTLEVTIAESKIGTPDERADINNLPELVLEIILSFIDSSVCCKNVWDLSILTVNKKLSGFYKNHFKYCIYEFVDLYKYNTIVKFSGKHAPKHLKFCMKPCNCLNFEESQVLKNLLQRYTRNKKQDDKYNFGNDDIPFRYKGYTSCLNVHFDDSKKLERFKEKLHLLQSNIRFYGGCCDGKGCDVTII